MTSPGASASPGGIGAFSAIVAENQHAGSSGWRIGGSGYHIASDVGAQVKGYASATSVDLGQSITLFASAQPAQPLKLDVYRIGWYGGRGGRLMRAGSWQPGVSQPACPIDPATWLRVCHWLPSVQFTVPTDWVSGIYLAVLTNADAFQNAIPFVVRSDSSPAPIIYLQPVTTYQAYNYWPFGEGGRSLYGTVRVSFDRPYQGSGVGRSFFDFEQPFVAWMERAGYDITYATGIDLDLQGAALLERHRVMVVAGHDEYWTASMRAAATTARDHGVSLAFFAADNVYWQARLEPASDGRPDRVLVCYRKAALDPEPLPALKTVRWRDPPVNQPEETLLGAQYTNIVAGRADWVVADASSWVYRGTGMANGDRIRGLVFGESDRVVSLPSADASPAASILSNSPYLTRHGGQDVSQAAVYQAASGAWVFDAGTFAWAGALNPFGRMDLRVDRMTRNLLDRMTGTVDGAAP